MARDASAFLDELEIDRIDLLGYSLGGTETHSARGDVAGQEA
jgi:pimeloyl-ACP methyl ester carboxylesterase